ncbi:MAG: trimeric intracellular cation channel family protein [Dehalococcoidia bacterium]
MDTAQLTSDVERVIEILGIIVFALSGAMLAIRKDFDIVGIVILAVITALGGGVIRDLLIGSAPPVAFDRLDYLLLPLGVAAVAAVAHTALERIRRPILVFDALGLALFTVNGTLIANNAGLGPAPAALLGITTGVGGGLIRDIVARDVPLIVRRDSEIYAIPAALGALLVALLHGVHGLNAAVVGFTAAALIFAVRAAAMTLGWRAPGALR